MLGTSDKRQARRTIGGASIKGSDGLVRGRGIVGVGNELFNPVLKGKCRVDKVRGDDGLARRQKCEGTESSLDHVCDRLVLFPNEFMCPVVA